MISRRKTTLRARQRSGTTIVLVIAFLVLIASIGSVGMRRLAMGKHWNRIQIQRLQADVVLESGLERAIVRIQRDPLWKGDVWALDLNSASSGVPLPEANKTEYQVVTQRVAGPDPAKLNLQIRVVKVGTQETVLENYYQGEMP